MVNNKVIRLSVANTIAANANIASSRVHNSKITPHMLSNLPAVGVFITDSNAEGLNHREPGFTRTLDINIECAVSGNESTYADECDDLLYEIKEALFKRSTWSEQFENVSGYTESITLEDAGERPLAQATLTISVELVEL